VMDFLNCAKRGLKAKCHIEAVGQSTERLFI
jgi:hypothetical protein